MELKIDEERINMTCGIPIRAKLNNKHGSYDLAQLDRESFIKWLSYDIMLTTNTLFALLDHDYITYDELKAATTANGGETNSAKE